MIKIIEAVPLMIFLGTLRIINTQIPENWRVPFMVSGCAGILVIGFALYKKQVLDRILLGFNLYFISGGAAFITHQWWLNNFYNWLQASGLLLWVCITGLAATLFSPQGFTGIKSPDPAPVKKYSVYLLLVSVAAFSLSFGFRGIKLLSELVPFIGLFVAQAIIKEHFRKHYFTEPDK